MKTEVTHREGKYILYSKTQFMAGVGLNWKDVYRKSFVVHVLVIAMSENLAAEQNRSLENTDD